MIVITDILRVFLKEKIVSNLLPKKTFGKTMIEHLANSALVLGLNMINRGIRT